jgi:hypothetical protein
MKTAAKLETKVVTNDSPKNLTWEGLLKLISRRPLQTTKNDIIVYIKETDKYLHVSSVDFNDKGQIILMIDNKEINNEQKTTEKIVQEVSADIHG